MLAPGVLIEQASNLDALQAAATEALGTCLLELREQRLSEGRKLALMVEERLRCYPHPA